MKRTTRNGIRRWMLVGPPILEAADGVTVRRYWLAPAPAPPALATVTHLADRRAAA